MALVVHVSLFKTTGAGEGFRRFRLGKKEPFRIETAHDFSAFQPFSYLGREGVPSMLLVLVSAPPALMATFTASSIGSLKGTSIRSNPFS